jgi:hypothetical protein
MDQRVVRDQLIAVLKKIQSDSGYSPTPVNGSTCPLTDLTGFDSKILPVAAVLLGEAIGMTIPNDKNIFARVNGADPTVDQIAMRVCSLVNSQATVA